MKNTKSLKQRLKVSRDTFYAEMRRYKREHPQKIVYMHTCDGCPASYNDQMVGMGGRSFPVVLVETLAQIKREQRASLRYRKAQGFDHDLHYGWQKVAIPT